MILVLHEDILDVIWKYLSKKDCYNVSFSCKTLLEFGLSRKLIVSERLITFNPLAMYVEDKVAIIENLMEVTFGSDFNQSLQGTSFPYLTHLTFGDEFNQSIYGISFPCLTHLTFGRNFMPNLHS